MRKVEKIPILINSKITKSPNSALLIIVLKYSKVETATTSMTFQQLKQLAHEHYQAQATANAKNTKYSKTKY